VQDKGIQAEGFQGSSMRDYTKRGFILCEIIYNLQPSACA
jgi:hypothetical protein